VLVPHVWQQASLADIPAFYRGALSDVSLWGLLAFVLLAMHLMLRGNHAAPPPQVPSGLRRHEWICMFLLALLPVFGIPLAHIAIGFSRGQYFFPALLGLAMITPAVLFRLEQGRTLIPLALIAGLAFWLGSHTLYQAMGAGKLRAAGLQEALLQLPPDPAPIFISSPEDLAELWYYGDPQIRRRVVSAASSELSLLAGGNDTVALNWLAIIRRVSVPVLPIDSFLRSTPRFFLADSGFWPWFFLTKGYDIKPLERPGIYLVTAPNSGH